MWDVIASLDKTRYRRRDRRFCEPHRRRLWTILIGNNNANYISSTHMFIKVIALHIKLINYKRRMAIPVTTESLL